MSKDGWEEIEVSPDDLEFSPDATSIQVNAFRNDDGSFTAMVVGSEEKCATADTEIDAVKKLAIMIHGELASYDFTKTVQ